MRTINPADLVPMDIFPSEPIAIDIVYAKADHPENIFGVAAYTETARMILHRDMARIVIATARLLRERRGWTLVLKDGLRVVEAQAALLDTQIVADHPHWLEEPRLLSPPGQGAHPRGMAIDVAATDRDGKPVNMGTVFDTMTEESARGFEGFTPAILENRKTLERGFLDASAQLGLPILPLPSEWWDFRFPRIVYENFAPLRESDLPEDLKMIGPCRDDSPEDHARFGRLAKDILQSL